MPVLALPLSEELHRALKVRAACKGHSVEDEARDILESTTRPHGRVFLGSLLAEVGRRAQLSDTEFAVLESASHRSPSRSAGFE